MAGAVVEKITIQGDSQGLEELAGDLNEVASAQGRLATATKATEAVTERSSRTVLSVQKAYERMARQVDATYRSEQLLARGQDVLNRALEQGVTDATQYGIRMEQLNVKYGQTGKAAVAANQNIKLTSGQIQGLGYQINDIGTMLALGASPFQVLASQAGQVIQVLQQGGGIKSSLAAIGTAITSLITPTRLIVGGLTAAAAAAIYFATKSDSSVKTAEEALKSYKTLVDGLKDSYARAGDAATRFFERAQKEGPNVAFAAIQGSQATLTASLQREMESLFDKTQNIADRSIKTFADLTPAVLKGQDAIRKLGSELDSGAITVGQFRDGIAQLRTDPTTAPAVKKIADSLLDGSANAYSLAAALGAVGEAASAASGKVGRLKVPSTQDMVAPFGGAIPMLDRLNPDAMDTIRKDLKDQRDELTGATKDVDDYVSKVAEMRTSLADNVGSLRTQIDTFGQSEGAIAAAKFQTDAMANAQRLATEANKSVIDPALVDFIKRQATEYGALTDKLTGLREVEQQRKRDEQEAAQKRERISQFEDDLLFERSVAGLPEVEQRVRETLHGLDVDYGSFEGQRLAAGLRYNDALSETQDRMKEVGEVGKGVFFDLIDAIGSGEGALGSFAKAFSGIGKQLASGGFDKLFAGLFGKSSGPGSSMSSGAGILDTIGGAGNFTAQPSAASRQTSIKLADTVTKSVSSNLLSSILGAGKDESHVSGLNANFATALTSMLQAAPEAVRSAVTINSGFRSVARQAELFDAALTKYGSVAAARKWVAPPGNSQHNAGNAADLGYANENAGSWMRANAGKFGLSFPMSYEPWHIQSAGGQGVTKAESQRLIETGVSKGMQRGLSEYDLGGYDSGSPRNPSGSQGATRGQAGMQVLGAAAGIFSQGYESGNILSGGLGGAMGGLGAAGSIASLFPAIAGVAGPVGMIAGAAIGALGSPLAGKKTNAKAHRERAKEYDNDRDQYLFAA